jgi:glycosyltransferase involved in cell wall biosynthesis
VTTISIVTPSLNQGKFLREALESVSTQNYTQIEHLVLDGGSTDQTLPVLRSFNDDKAWDHLRWTSAPDNGQSDALNRGFAQARGDIIGWLNSDDRYRRGCFEHIVKTFDEHPEVDILYGDFTVMNESGKLLELRREIAFNRFILFYHRVLYIPTPATFFRRRVFEDGNRLRTDLHYAMDYEFFLRLARAGYRIRHTPRLLADFRLHPASKSCSDAGRQADEKREILYSMSTFGARLHSARLRRFTLLALQFVAGVMRWSEKLARGYYFNQHRPESLAD